MWKVIRDLLWDIVVVWGGIALFLVIATESIYYFYQYETKGMVVTAVLDSGLSVEQDGYDEVTLYPFNFVDWGRSVEDESGHGSNITAIIHDMSPNTFLMPLKVTSGKDNETWGSCAFAVLYSVLRGADVVNMSFSQEKNPLLDWMIQYGESKGVIFIAATGNEGVDKVRSPADIEGVISVAAINDDSQLYKYSNVGDKTVFAAPGLHVKTSHLPSDKEKGDVVYQSGTSFSAGYISGVVSYLLEKEPDLSQEQIEAYLHQLSSGVSSDGTRSSDNLRSVQFEKIQATENDTLYLALRPEKTRTSDDSVTLYIDSHHADTVRLYIRPSSEHMQEINIVSSGEQAVRVPLTEGYNKIRGFVHEDNASVLEEVEVLKDTSPPIIEYHGTRSTIQGEEHMLLLEDYGISDIQVDGKTHDVSWNELSFHGETQTRTRKRWLTIPVNGKERSIEVTDDLGYITRYIIPAPTV